MQSEKAANMPQPLIQSNRTDKSEFGAEFKHTNVVHMLSLQHSLTGSVDLLYWYLPSADVGEGTELCY